MSVQELKICSERYTEYMQGKRQRLRIPQISFNFDFSRLKDATDSLKYALEQLNKVRPNTNIGLDLVKPHHNDFRLIIGGVSHGKTALMEALMKDMHKHGMAIHVTKERSGSIEQTHIPFDALTYKLNFDPDMLKDLAEMAGGLPEKVQKDPLDEPENWLAPEPPKQKKFRSYQPDKRALNRKNRKKK